MIFDDDDVDTDGADVRLHLLRLHSAMLAGFVAGVDWPPREWAGCLDEMLERPDLPPIPEFTDAQLAAPFGADVRALAAGEAFKCARGDLPGWHPAARAGAGHDRFLLTEDDELIDDWAGF
ncbi:hypothetical protein BH11ACT6_BH11ACT6_03640 [soil metagenome]